jgi:hypothetical protein
MLYPPPGCSVILKLSRFKPNLPAGKKRGNVSSISRGRRGRRKEEKEGEEE